MRRGGRRKISHLHVKVSLFIDRTNWEWLTTRHRYDASKVVRDLVADYRRKIEEPTRSAAQDLADLDLDLL
jgi:hypothetical protein